MLDIKGVYHDVHPKWSIGKSRGCETLVFVTEGKVIYWLGDNYMEVKKGELLYIPSTMDRAWTSHPDELHQKYTVVFLWNNQTQESPLPFMKQDESFRLKLRNATYFEQRFAFLFVQWLGKRAYYEALSRHVLSELLTLAAQQRSERHASPTKERMARKIQEYMLSDIHKNVTIEELSELVGITPNYVTILFKEVIGTTPIQYMHQIRINTAVNLLENTHMTVRAVAEYLGYCDQAYFHRMFKKFMGAAPTDIRK